MKQTVRRRPRGGTVRFKNLAAANASPILIRAHAVVELTPSLALLQESGGGLGSRTVVEPVADNLTTPPMTRCASVAETLENSRLHRDPAAESAPASPASEHESAEVNDPYMTPSCAAAVHSPTTRRVLAVSVGGTVQGWRRTMEDRLRLFSAPRVTTAEPGHAGARPRRGPCDGTEVEAEQRAQVGVEGASWDERDGESAPRAIGVLLLDGHRGAAAADLALNVLPATIASALAASGCSWEAQGSEEGGAHSASTAAAAGLHIRTSSEVGEQADEVPLCPRVYNALVGAFVATDAELLERQVGGPGTVAAAIRELAAVAPRAECWAGQTLTAPPTGTGPGSHLCTSPSTLAEPISGDRWATASAHSRALHKTTTAPASTPTSSPHTLSDSHSRLPRLPLAVGGGQGLGFLRDSAPALCVAAYTTLSPRAQIGAATNTTPRSGGAAAAAAPAAAATTHSERRTPQRRLSVSRGFQLPEKGEGSLGGGEGSEEAAWQGGGGRVRASLTSSMSTGAAMRQALASSSMNGCARGLLTPIYRDEDEDEDEDKVVVDALLEVALTTTPTTTTTRTTTTSTSMSTSPAPCKGTPATRAGTQGGAGDGGEHAMLYSSHHSRALAHHIPRTVPGPHAETTLESAGRTEYHRGEAHELPTTPSAALPETDRADATEGAAYRPTLSAPHAAVMAPRSPCAQATDGAAPLSTRSGDSPTRGGWVEGAAVVTTPAMVTRPERRGEVHAQRTIAQATPRTNAPSHGGDVSLGELLPSCTLADCSGTTALLLLVEFTGDHAAEGSWGSTHVATATVTVANLGDCQAFLIERRLSPTTTTAAAALDQAHPSPAGRDGAAVMEDGSAVRARAYHGYPPMHMTSRSPTLPAGLRITKLSADHRPAVNAAERQRLTERFGNDAFLPPPVPTATTCRRGAARGEGEREAQIALGRVGGRLAVSRALGDFDLKLARVPRELLLALGTHGADAGPTSDAEALLRAAAGLPPRDPRPPPSPFARPYPPREPTPSRRRRRRRTPPPLTTTTTTTTSMTTTTTTTTTTSMTAMTTPPPPPAEPFSCALLLSNVPEVRQLRVPSTRAGLVDGTGAVPDEDAGDSPSPRSHEAVAQPYTLLLAGSDGVWELQSAAQIVERVEKHVQPVLAAMAVCEGTDTAGEGEGGDGGYEGSDDDVTEMDGEGSLAGRPGLSRSTAAAARGCCGRLWARRLSVALQHVVQETLQAGISRTQPPPSGGVGGDNMSLSITLLLH